MYVGLKQPRGDGQRYVTPARAAAKETTMVLTKPYNDTFNRLARQQLHLNHVQNDQWKNKPIRQA